MISIPFFKMSGSGNDFIVIDNREDRLAAIPIAVADVAVKVCRRAMSVGADGLILVEDTDGADFSWRFFNADGSVAEMCGNGARCAARFAYMQGIAGPDMRFETDAGIIFATVLDRGVRLKMTDPEDLETGVSLTVGQGEMAVSRINTGVPHVVAAVADVNAVDVVGLGREIRYHERFAPAGTNVNFICPIGDNTLAIRTYERGVEDETLACGARAPWPVPWSRPPAVAGRRPSTSGHAAGES